MTYRQFCQMPIYSFRSPSYNRSIASSTASSPRSAIQCFLFQFTVFSRFLMAVQQLRTPSSSFPVTIIFPSITCSRRQFIRQRRPITLDVLVFTVCRIFRYGTKQTEAVNETKPNKDCKRNKYPRQKRYYCWLTVCVCVRARARARVQI